MNSSHKLLPSVIMKRRNFSDTFVNNSFSEAGAI